SLAKNDPPAEQGQGGPILNYGFFCLATLAHLATILITWDLWQARNEPPNLPLFDVPTFSFGFPILISLAYQLWNPEKGFPIHVFVLIVAIVFDQFRLQPQVISVLVLMLGTLNAIGHRIARWYLAALWLWTGIHKLFSAHWFAHSSFWILTAVGFDETLSKKLHWSFAASVAFAEVTLGAMAIFRYRLAAILCVILHVSIAFLMMVIQWNFSVVPWNLATALVGGWIFWQSNDEFNREIPTTRYKSMIAGCAVMFFVVPAGFYFGWTDRAFSGVLYSDNLPRGLITGKTDLRLITGWEKINVPFPRNHNNFRHFFELTAQPGDKLHIFEPRRLVEDEYFILTTSGSQKITSKEFFQHQENSVAGQAAEDRYSSFWLKKYGKITQHFYNPNNKVTDNRVSHAFTMEPTFYSADALKLLSGLPNLKQLQLKNCPVDDEDLQILARLKHLEGLGLSNSNITDAALPSLKNIPNLRQLEIKKTKLSPAARRQIAELLRNRKTAIRD
ncbi:MAG: hypothetical protein AAGA30_13465, partial [Planctomycetota bacterium]